VETRENFTYFDLVTVLEKSSSLIDVLFCAASQMTARSLSSAIK